MEFLGIIHLEGCIMYDPRCILHFFDYFSFLAAIVALYMTMSVGRSVGRMVGRSAMSFKVRKNMHRIQYIKYNA